MQLRSQLSRYYLSNSSTVSIHILKIKFKAVLQLFGVQVGFGVSKERKDLIHLTHIMMQFSKISLARGQDIGILGEGALIIFMLTTV